jgi:hypothetical protein
VDASGCKTSNAGRKHEIFPVNHYKKVMAHSQCVKCPTCVSAVGREVQVTFPAFWKCVPGCVPMLDTRTVHRGRGRRNDGFAACRA